MKEASYYEKLADSRVHCLLCPHGCKPSPGQCGICLTRVNRDGMLVSENYERPVSIAMDPIEKKPLYHFHPGSSILSTGPNGCNLKCLNCQNCEISQKLLRTDTMTSDELVTLAKRNRSIGIAYTYTEPFIWFEFLRETAEKIQNAGLKNVLVTNGYVNEKPLRELLPFIHAMNIDIKSMEPDFYKKICKGTLEPVLRTCEISRRQCHIEITNLLITGLNDSDEMIHKIVDYVAEKLGDDTPLHFSRYFPRYKMDTPATPAERIQKAWEIGCKRLKYVYAGNINLEQGSNTVCYSCGNVLVEREGYDTVIRNLKGNSCVKCGTKHNFVI